MEPQKRDSFGRLFDEQLLDPVNRVELAVSSEERIVTSSEEEERVPTLSRRNANMEDDFIDSRYQKDKQRAFDDGIFEQSGTLSPWPAKKIAESEEQTETYATPLTPRRQDKRTTSKHQGVYSSSKSAKLPSGDNDLVLLSLVDVGRGHRSSHLKSNMNRRSASSDDIFAADSTEIQNGYRRMERTLEAQSRQQQIKRSPMDDTLPPTAFNPLFAIAGPGSVSNQQRPISNVTFPSRSSSRGRSKRASQLSRQSNSEAIEVSKANVTFRNRALSEPLNSLNSGEMHPDYTRRVSEETQSRRDRRQQLEEEQDDRRRRLSLPHLTTTVKRLSAGPFSTRATPSPIMPWEAAARSTPLSSRLAVTGEGNSKVSYDNYRGLSTSTRPSLTLILQYRAQARYHLSALSAMRPRLPVAPYSNLSTLLYKSWLPRTHHTFLFLITYFQVLATIFFDYNVLYSIVQVAIHPSSNSSGVSVAWWIASGIYIVSLLFWFVGVIIVWEFIIQYRRRLINCRPFAMPIYLSSSGSTLSSIQSFSLYSLFYRARLSAKPRDFIIETFWFYSQNWPTLLTLLPRSIILIVFLVLYNPHSGTEDAPINAQMRDPTYFNPSTGLLKTFSFGILVAYAAWIGWRLLILLIAYIGLIFTLGLKAIFEREKTSYDWGDNDSIVPHQNSRREALRQRAFSSTLVHQPLLTGVEEYHRYSSLEAHGYLREDQNAAMPLYGSPEQQRSRSVPANVPLPRWAWKAKAEERIIALLMQSSQLDSDLPASTSLWPLSQQGGAPSSEVCVAVHPEMQEVRTARSNYNQAGPSRYANQSIDSNALEMKAIYPPILNRKSGEARPSTSSDVRRSVEFHGVAPPIPMAIAAIADGNLSQSRTSLQKRGEKRGRLSNSSEFSVYGDALARTSIESRYNSERTASIRSRATIGQEANALAPDETETADPFPTNSAPRSPVFEERDPLASVMVPSSAVLSDVVAAPAAKKQRASTSLSSLSESLRFMWSNKSVDMMESGSSEPSTSKAGISSSGKGESAWRPTVLIGRLKGNEAATLPKEQEQEAVTPTMSAGDLIEEEAASQKTQETTTTEDDSEEGRLWSQFPEQSRRFPPGFIALDHEQKRLSLEEEGRLSGEEISGPSSTLMIRESSREEALTSGGEEGLRPIEEESYGGSSHESASNDT